ncbi:MAG: 50S ribosomal protein L23 [Candidatus Pacebacteria bacterium]|nr:50S ribosomal protein L23 [Candidatus Paceibacterota bacterium]
MNKFLMKKPIISEKAMNMSSNGKYVFLVADKATVSEIKKIVEKEYNVKVVKANVINVKSKTRKLGRSIGTKPGYKKIILTLKQGQKLDILPQ